MTSEYSSRLTVDLDAKDYGFHAFRLKAVSIWCNLDRVADRREVHVSSSGRGLHFVGWFVDEIDQDTQVKLRQALGDDPRRTDMDVQRYKNGLYTDVLFTEKCDREFSKERRFRDVYDALDHIAAQRSDAERMRRLIDYGHRGAPELAQRVGGMP